MIQREIILKKLLEVQQQRMQELAGVRQQPNFRNQLLLNEQATRMAHFPLVDGIANQDASQNFVDCQTYGIRPLQPNVSLYGTSVASSGCDLSWYSHHQGASHDSASILTDRNYNQTQMPITQPTASSNSFSSEKSCGSPNNVYMFNGSLQPISEQAYSRQRNTLIKESRMTREQTSFPVNSMQRIPENAPIWKTSPLDPLEAKILFSTDENSWESVARQRTRDVGRYQGMQEYVESVGPYSSNQSGSWSALMQSAVSEASSTDTGQQEEWSGLTFQNPELSSDNQPINFIGSGNQQSCWADNNLPSVSSPTSKPEALMNPDMQCSFPGFQQSNYQVVQQRQAMDLDSFHESDQDVVKHPDRDGNFPGFHQSNLNQGHERKEKGWLQSSTSYSSMECGQNLSVQMHPPDFGGNLRAAEHASPKNSAHYIGALFDSAADFPVQSTIAPSEENSGGDRNAGNAGFGGSRPSCNVSCIDDSDNQPYYNSMSPSQGLDRKVHLSDRSDSGPFYKGSYLSDQQFPDATTRNPSPAIAPAITSGLQANSGMLQQIGLPLGTSKVSVDMTSRQSAWQSEVPLASPASTHEQYKTSTETDVYPRRTRGFDSRGNLGVFSEESPPTSLREVYGQERVAEKLSKAQSVTSAASTTACHQVLNRERQRQNCSPETLQRDAGRLNNPFQFPNGYQHEFSLVHQSHYLKNLDTEVPLHSKQVGYGLNCHHANVHSTPPFIMQNSVNPQPNSSSLLDRFQSGKNTPLSCSSGGRTGQFDHDAAHASGLQNQGINKLNQLEAYSHSGEQHQFSPQMNQPLFKYSGTLNTVQFLPLNDLRGMKDVGRQISNFQSVGNFQGVNSPSERLNDFIPGQHGTVLRSRTSPQVAPILLSPPHMLSSDGSLRPKKRKAGVLDLRPWYIEVASGSCQLETLSCLAKAEWEMASGRLSEKIEDQTEINQDVLPTFQARKRLSLTTQLMQQVIRPATRAILCADARSNGESVVFFLCLLALGDACRLTNDSYAEPVPSAMPLRKLGASNSTGKLDFLKALENFIERARRLENDLLRLEKLPSIAETKLEIQELDKFSTITRFCKFHSKGNSASADASSDATIPRTVLKTGFQRQVVPHPWPEIVPDATKCFSL